MPANDSGLVAATLPPQTLSGTGRIYFDTTGMGAYGLVVTGTAVMTARYIATSGDKTTSTTPNRPWKGGASLGTNTFGYNSTSFGPVNSEYRFVGGRRYFVVECTSFTSGSLTFTLYELPSANIVYIGGGIQNEQDEATVAGTVFNAATSFISTANNSYLNFVFENPATSGKLAIIKLRRFSSSITGAFGGVATPTAASFDNQTGSAAPVALTPSNLRTGTAAVPAAASLMSCKYNMGTVRVDSSPSTTNPAGDLLLANVPFNLDVPRVVPPGARFSHFIGGAGGGLNATAMCSIYALWEEKDLY